MAQEHSDTNMTARILSYIFVALLAFAGGFLVGNWNVDGGDAATDVGAAASPDGAANLADSSKIPVGDSPVKGPADAPVTIVEFSEFQCPFCARGSSTVDQLVEKYPNDIRVVFKHFPLNFHKQAPAASKAALAAREQGKFWEMHDKIFENQKQLKGKSDDEIKEWTAGFAKELGLDVAQFKKDFDKPEYQATIDEDMKLGQELGVRGTPHFFINGERLSGAQPLAKFEEVFKGQLEEAKKMLAAGTARPELYAKAVDKNFAAPAEQKQKPSQPQQTVAMVPVEENDAVKGETDDYLVTMAVFSEFQCPFCARSEPTIAKILENYGDKVRFVFKHNPLPFHNEAGPAAKAAMAAGEQGKFWEMHDLLFENQKRLKEPGIFEELAKQLGLNVSKFKKDMDSPKFEQKIKADQALAAKVGARGTPNFFINGVQVIGAKPYPAFESVIKDQIAKAEKLKAKGLKGEKLYAAAVELNEKEAPKAAPQPSAPDKPADKVDTADLKLGDAPTKGPDNAPVTIVEFSEFQCPYCARGTTTLEEVLKDYEGKVKVAFKHYPLPFHKQAEGAAKAAMAAGEQGKFWEMHDLLFQNQKRLGDDLYTELAKQLGLNMAKFEQDMKDPKWDKLIKADMAQGQKVGVRGTPAFFINGTRLVGAQPAPKFKAAIDQALKEAK